MVRRVTLPSDVVASICFSTSASKLLTSTTAVSSEPRTVVFVQSQRGFTLVTAEPSVRYTTVTLRCP